MLDKCQRRSCQRHSQVLALNVDPVVKVATLEDIRTVAKEARAVIEEEPSYDEATLDAFSEALTPAFERAMRVKQSVSGPQC